MKNLTKAALLATLTLGLAHPALAKRAAEAPAAPVAAPSAPVADTAPVVASGIGVANIEAIKANSNAFKLAEQQRQISYKATIDQARARAQQIDAQLKALAAKIDADRKAPKPNQDLINQEIGQAQQLQQSGQQEVNKILEPVALSQAYVDEQINGNLGAAIGQAMKEQQVTLLLQPQAILVATSKAYDLNLAILTKLNAALPAAQIVPPAGWEPREVREQKAAEAAQSAPAATAQQPSGR
ncbi:MAG: hypothetical protein RLZZ136_260 [Pseudomonadota bacterium]|jgi:Skp family chaperone for outer membrane proteins